MGVSGLPAPSGVVGRRPAGTPLRGLVYGGRRRDAGDLSGLFRRSREDVLRKKTAEPLKGHLSRPPADGCRSSGPRDGDLGRAITRAPRDSDEPFTGSWKILQPAAKIE